MMKRNRFKKADAIFTADNHFRIKAPVARKDDFLQAQWDALLSICALQEKHDCEVYVAGDFLDIWKASPELLSALIKFMPDNKWNAIYGDHDIPNKNMKFVHKSGLHTLQVANKLKIIEGGHGADKNDSVLPKKQQPSVVIKGKRILLWHILTFKNELPFPGCENKSAKQLLRRYPQFDCIVTGDNHKPFIQKFKGRLLVNCGSMMRNKADQIEHKPAVWLYYADENKVVPHYLPIESDILSREHIDKKKNASDRIDAFVTSLNTKMKVGMSFEQNMVKFLKKNKVKRSIKNVINKYV